MSGVQPGDIERSLSALSPTVARLLAASVEGRELSVAGAVALCDVTGRDLHGLVTVADELRRRQCGDDVGYVINRNINFTNVCTMSCKFCAFSRTRRSDEGYYLDTEEIVRRTLEAQRLGATEVCLQAGLPPDAEPHLYVKLLVAIKQAAPDIHIHAYSPEEVKYGAALAGVSIDEHLHNLAEAGLGTLPGTSAEILDDDVRRRIAGGRISTAEWLDVIQRAHRIGLRTTCTIMHGHLESHQERMAHIVLLRSVQKETGGFTEFVPLSFIHTEAPLFMKEMANDVRPGPTGNDVIRLMAISRLLLGETIVNIQTSWVKEGLRQAQWLLNCGANDLGGTLMNESISTSAGAAHGQLMRPAELRRAIRDAGRVPVQRDTTYGVLRRFDAESVDDPHEPLDDVQDVEAQFGSYVQLTAKARQERHPES